MVIRLARRLSRRYPWLDPWDVSSWVWESLWRATGESPFGAPSNVYRPGGMPFAAWVAYLARGRCAREANDDRIRSCGVRVRQLSGATAARHSEDRRVVEGATGGVEPCARCGTRVGRAEAWCKRPARIRGLCKSCYDKSRYQSRSREC